MCSTFLMSKTFQGVKTLLSLCFFFNLIEKEATFAIFYILDF